MKKLFSLFFAASLAVITFAQSSVVLCENYDEYGKVTGVYQSWDIKAAGSYVYIVYNQDLPINSNSMYLYLDYIYSDGGEFQAYQTIALEPVDGKNWLMYDCLFTEPGKYRIQIQGDGVLQAETFTEIFFAEGEEALSKSADINAPNSEFDTYYYENSTIAFCDSASADGLLFGESDEFSMKNGEPLTITVYLSNPLAFETEKFQISIYDEVEYLVDEFSLDIEKDWDWAKYNQTFNEPGFYIIDIYTTEGVFFNTAEVIITK